MKLRTLRHLLLLTGFACVLVEAHSQCVTCSGDYSKCSGYTSSKGRLGCQTTCACGDSVVSYLDTLHPGFFLKDEGGRKVVASVVPGSPADVAGIRASDVILAINPGAAATCQQGWLQRDSGDSAVVRFSRHGKVETIDVGLMTIREYLTRAGALEANPNLKRVSLTSNVSLSAAFHALGRQ